MIDRRQFCGMGTLAAGALAAGTLDRAFAMDSKPQPGATVKTTAGRIRGQSA